MPLLEWTHGPVIPNTRREAANKIYMQRLEPRAMGTIVVPHARSSFGMSSIPFLDCTPIWYTHVLQLTGHAAIRPVFLLWSRV